MPKQLKEALLFLYEFAFMDSY